MGLFAFCSALFWFAYRPSLDLDGDGYGNYKKIRLDRKESGRVVYNLEAAREAPTFVISLYSRLFVLAYYYT